MSELQEARATLANFSSKFWHTAALSQIDQFERVIANVAQRHRLKAEVVSTHRSKSIELPVVKLTTDAGEFTLRDNFSDVNLMAILGRPATLSLREFFHDVQEPRTWDWYLAEVARVRGYSWREWTDEELADPRILRVRDRRPGTDRWWDTTPDKKARWTARLTDPAWYSHDCAHDAVTWEGNFGPGVELFIQSYAYAEGITVTTGNRAYRKGIKDFMIAVNTHVDAEALITQLTAAAV